MAATIRYTYKEGYTRIVPREYNAVTVMALGEAGGTAPASSVSDAPVVLERTRLLSIAKLPCSWRNVYAVGMDLRGDFAPGDAVGLVVPNSDEAVDRLMALCGIEDGACRIERTGRAPFVFEGRVRDFFKHRCDLSGIPRKMHLLNLARTSPMRAHIEYICSPEGARDYVGLGLGWHGIVDVIEFFGCRPSLEDLVRNCDVIKPRYYTLVNGREDRYEILVGELSRSEGPGVRYGHVSGYVNALCRAASAGAVRGVLPEVETAFRRSVLVGRIEVAHLICFCTGTGIALFLALYRNRPAGQRITLVYGYRNDEDDISRLYDLDCTVLRAKSAEGVRVTHYCDVIGPHRGHCRVVICGSMGMQRSTFVAIRRLYPELAAEHRIILDSWQ